MGVIEEVEEAEEYYDATEAEADSQAEELDDEQDDEVELELDDEAEGEGESDEGEAEKQETSVTPEEQAKAEKAKRKEELAAANDAALVEFKKVVEEVISDADWSSSNKFDEQPAALRGKVTTAYAAFPTKAGQNAAKRWAQEQMQARMIEGPSDPSKFDEARSYLGIYQICDAAVSVRETIIQEPVDPTVAHVDHVAALLLAPNFVTVPDGVKDDWQEQAQKRAGQLATEAGTYLAWLRKHTERVKNDPNGEATEGDEPQVSAVIKSAARIGAGRLTGGATRGRKPKGEGGSTGSATASSSTRSAYAGPRRDIAAHIVSAFAGVPVGTFLSVSEIVKHVSSEYGAGSPPSQGAVSARLFPKSGNPCSVPGINPVGPEAGHGSRGAIKTA